MNIRTAILALGLGVATLASAQGLHKEINVDQKIEPVKRDASRINVLPTLQLPAVSRPQLSFSDRVVTTRVPNAITTLAPMAYGDKLYESPYRGYVVLGLGAPLFNASFSAGYRAIDTEKTRLSFWSQYNGDIYRDKVTDLISSKEEYTNYWRDHSASVGADLHQSLGKSSALDAAVDYTYGYHTVPVGYMNYPQNISRANASALFSSRTDALSYTAGLHYGHFGFYHMDFPTGYSHLLKDYPAKGTRQNLFGAEGSVSLPIGETSDLGLDINADFLRTGYHVSPEFPPYDLIKGEAAGTSGLISLTPHFDFGSQAVKGSLGLQADITTGGGKTFHIAPEVTLAWTPSQVFGIEVKAHGGSTLNSLAGLYDVSPYLNSFMAYGQSHIPYAIDGRFSVGPFFGGYIEVFGGYAKANDWLMPAGYNKFAGEGVYDTVDLSAWHAGAAIGYDYRNIFSARVSYETAPNDYDKSYYEWRDRAKHVINAELRLRPIEPLLVSLNWEFRGGRRTYYYIPGSFDEGPLGTVYTPYAESLGCVSNLSLSAGYTVTEALTVFVNGQNLLNRRPDLIGFRPAQGTNVMIGASLKF